MNGFGTGLKMVAAFLGAWWLGLPGLVQVLILLMALDMVAGVVRATADRKLSSDVMFTGVTKKVMVLLLVGMAHLIEPYVAGLPLGSAAAGYYVAHEALSITENVVAAGLPVPQWLKNALVKLQEIPGKKTGEEK